MEKPAYKGRHQPDRSLILNDTAATPNLRNPRFGAVALAGYAAAIWAANWTTSHAGLVHLGFGYTVTAGTFFAGMALVLRNQVQDWLGRWAVLAAILLGAGLSAWTSTSLALASATAFALGEGMDMAVYTPLREKGWARAATAAAPFGAIVDTVVFLSLAHFPLTFHGITGQFAVKTLVAWFTVSLVAVVRKRRKVVRHGQASPDAVGV